MSGATTETVATMTAAGAAADLLGVVGTAAATPLSVFGAALPIVAGAAALLVVAGADLITISRAGSGITTTFSSSSSSFCTGEPFRLSFLGGVDSFLRGGGGE